MKTTTLCLIMAALCGQAHADSIEPDSATRFIKSFYQAIQKHDLAAVSNMLDNRVVIKVLWTQADPPQTFSLSKADYLQQLKATWRFASNDSYQIKNLNVNVVDGTAIASVQSTENRLLFGNKAGQNSDLKISIAGDKNAPRIVGINSKVEMW